jgi:hypothetical protein
VTASANDLGRGSGIVAYLETVRGRRIVCVKDLESAYVRGRGKGLEIVLVRWSGSLISTVSAHDRGSGRNGVYDGGGYGDRAEEARRWSALGGGEGKAGDIVTEGWVARTGSEDYSVVFEAAEVVLLVEDIVAAEEGTLVCSFRLGSLALGGASAVTLLGRMNFEGIAGSAQPGWP